MICSECRKTKAKVTDASSAMSQSEYEAITLDRCKARENAHVKVTIGIGFASHWLKKWREFAGLLQSRSVAQSPYPFW